MTVPSEMIYYLGVAAIGAAALIIAAAVPMLIISGKRLKKQLDYDYGNNSRTI